MRIESIEKARKGGKFRVCFDEGTELLLSKEVIIDFGLRRNDEISGEARSKLQDAQAYRDAYFAAVRLLNYRMRTRSELVRRLQEKGFERAVIDKVIAKMSDVGFVDDSKFAEAFVATKVASKPVGKRELERGLREKGIGKETVRQALAQVGDDETQLRLALDAAKVKMKALGKYDSLKRRDKLAAFLARRGFEWDVIKKVVRKLVKGDADAFDL